MMSEFETIRVFYAGDQTVFFATHQHHWFENHKPLTYYLWHFGDPQAQEFTFPIDMSVYIEGACVDKGNVGIFVNHLVSLDNPHGAWVPRCYLHTPGVHQATCIPLGTLNQQDPDYSSWQIMRWIGCKQGIAVFTSVGEINDMNMHAFNVRTGRVQKRS